MTIPMRVGPSWDDRFEDRKFTVKALGGDQIMIRPGKNVNSVILFCKTNSMDHTYERDVVRAIKNYLIGFSAGHEAAINYGHSGDRWGEG